MPYILEVQKFLWNETSEHVGYIKKIFNTKSDACAYYDLHNPHMRSLNAHNNWCSDWDPKSFLIYIVREHFYEHLNIPGFENDWHVLLKKDLNIPAFEYTEIMTK